MKIKFPLEEESFSPQDAHNAYMLLVDNHLHFLKLQSKCEFFYWKLMGVFVFCIVCAFILQDKGMIADAMILITMLGIGCLFIFIQNAIMDLKYAAKATSYRLLQ